MAFLADPEAVQARKPGAIVGRQRPPGGGAGAFAPFLVLAGLGRAPLDEAFEGVELRQAEVVVDLRGVAVAVLGALPELAAVSAAGEHRPVLLRLVAEDRLLLALDVVRAERHDAL